MTLSYIPLFGLTYFFWWVKPKDIETASEIVLPTMSEAQKEIFESMAISNDFDHEGTLRQTSYWTIWYLTPRIFEKVNNECDVEQIAQETTENRGTKEEGRSTLQCSRQISMEQTDEVVLGHWDPDLYHSKLLWPVTCFFGVSFPALHLISWDGTFPTVLELWLWRGAAIASMTTMLVFMQHERIIVRGQNPLTLIKLVSPAVYLLSRVVMMVEAIVALRASNPAIYETYIIGGY